MNKFIIVFLLALILNFLQANNEIFISPKIALKMIDKKEITFISLDNNNLKIKKSKKLDIKFLKSSDILGHTECEPFYACAKRLKKYFSNLNISNNQSLVIYDESHGIKSATLYVALESMGHKNIRLLRGGVKEISKLDPNWAKYIKYLDVLQNENTNTKKTIIQKINILKSHLLIEDANSTYIDNSESNYTVTNTSTKYLLSRQELKEVVQKVRSKDSNVTMINACEMLNLTEELKPLLWKELIDSKKGYLKSNQELEKLFESLELHKNENTYVYCMSGAEKAFYVMMALRELGYSKVKAFTGDWNRWEGDIDDEMHR